ncbi:MAG: DUF3775 domain-containing protein [Candidatus Thiodiazotropha sp.]|jgi:hypothetical protein
MLNLNPETVCFIISKARQYQAKEEVVITEQPDSPSDDWARQILANHDGDPCVDEVKQAFNDLEPDQRAELVALMWLGRGDYLPSEWRAAVNDAAESLEEMEQPGLYLLSHPLVADYLLEGLDLHDYSCSE